MHEARYFLPDHPQLRDVYSREELRAMLLSGRLKRSDIIVDDLTGLGHLLGDFLSWPDVKPFVPEIAHASSPNSPSPPQPAPVVQAPPPPLPAPKLPQYQEFRATTPLTTPRRAEDDEEDEASDDHFDPDEDDEEDEYFQEDDGEDDDEEEEEAHAAIFQHERPDERMTTAPGRAAPWPVHHADFDAPATLSDDEPKEAQEYLLHHFHPSWWSYRKAILVMLICGAVGYFSYHAKMSLAYPFTAGSFLVLCLLNTWLDRTSVDYYITTRRVEAERGLLGRSSDEIRIADIRAIDVQMKGFNRLLGIGAIHFSSGGGPLLDVHFKNVRNPHRIKRIVRDLLG